MADWISTAATLATGLLGTGGLVAGIVNTRKARIAVDDAKAKAELVRAETQQQAQAMIAAELGSAKGQLAKATERLEEASQAAEEASLAAQTAQQAAEEARAAHEDCGRRLGECEDKHESAQSILRQQSQQIVELGTRVRAIQLAAGIPDDVVRRFTPPAFPKVVPPDGKK